MQKSPKGKARMQHSYWVDDDRLVSMTRIAVAVRAGPAQHFFATVKWKTNVMQ